MFAPWVYRRFSVFLMVTFILKVLKQGTLAEVKFIFSHGSLFKKIWLSQGNSFSSLRAQLKMLLNYFIAMVINNI